MSPIHHTFAPLADAAFCWRSLSLLLRPSSWRKGPDIEALRAELAWRFAKSVYLFSSGREALLAGLRAAGIGDGDEVIVQGYTCIVVPNAIEASGAKTIYADIDPDTLNLTPETVEAVMTPHTKAIICQHTFGMPAALSELRALCDQKGILLIEDCAHVLPDDQGPTGLAETGDMVLFSFGRDKAISGVSGGAILVRGEAMKGLRAMEDAAKELSTSHIMRLLLYPLLYALAKRTYGLGGKVLLALCGKVGLLLPIVGPEEKKGRMNGTLHRLPNACADLALSQLRRVRGLNAHRRMLTAHYLTEGKARGLWRKGGEDDIVPAGVMEGLPLQKFPLFAEKADNIRRLLKAHGAHLDDGWTGCVICPRMADTEIAGYVQGSDPKAEEVAKSILSLPTHPTMTKKQADALLDALAPLLAASVRPQA